MTSRFDALPLPPALLGGLARQGFETPTAVQAAALPLLLEGKDAIVQAKTGSGKTLAAFLVGLDRLAAQPAAESGTRLLYISPLKALNYDIERNLQGEGEREITSRELGEEVMKRLQALDEVAYVRFASVYRSFRDIAEFMSELKDLLDEQATAARGPARRTRG